MNQFAVLKDIIFSAIFISINVIVLKEVKNKREPIHVFFLAIKEVRRK